MNIGLFDMDGSLADYEKQLRQDLQKCLCPEDLEKLKETSMWKFDEIPHVKNIIKLIKSQTNWWRSLPVIGAGFLIFDMAKNIGFKNHILTKGPKSCPSAWKEKLEWCQHYFDPQIEMHITSDKGMVYGKFLYDDYPEYMERWLKFRPRGLGIMPVNDYNKDFDHPRCVKWDGTNISEVKAALESCYNRKVEAR